jgi:hypothetical protein
LTSRRFTEAELEEVKDRNPRDHAAAQWVTLRRNRKRMIAPRPKTR